MSTAPRKLISNIDLLPLPDRESFVDREKCASGYYGCVITSRGCPYHCTYCASHQIWARKVRYRSVENVIREIKLLYDKYNVRNVRFQDDTFNLDKGRVVSFCNSLIKEKLPNLRWSCYIRGDCIDKKLAHLMRLSGCSQVYIGLESGSPRILEMIKKGETLEEIKRGVRICKEAGLQVLLFVMMGFPTETEEEVNMTIMEAIKMKPRAITADILTPHPGTEIYTKLCQEGKIQVADNYLSFYHQSPYMGISDIPSERYHRVKRKFLHLAERYNAISSLLYILHQLSTNFRNFVQSNYINLMHEFIPEFEKRKYLIMNIFKRLLSK